MLRFLSSLLLIAASTFSLAAQAHISLDFPTSRYRGDQQKLKASPCGAAGDQRTTDPSLISTFTPGQKITVTWTEMVQHDGHFTIAFDSDGQDFEFPTVAQPPGVTILADPIASHETPSSYSYEVTLPNVECSHCTLQLIQVMTTFPPPYDESLLYFQCADLVLKGSGGSGGAGLPATGGTSAGGAGGTGAVSAGGVASASGGSGLQSATGGVAASAPAADEGGCSLGRARGSGLAGIAALSLLVWSRRRRLA